MRNDAPTKTGLARLPLAMALALLAGCWTTSSSDEPALDPKEAQPREVVQKTEAEVQRDDRFQDRRRRRVRLDEPAGAGPPK